MSLTALLLPCLSVLFGSVPKCLLLKRNAGLYFIAAAFKKHTEKKRKKISLKTWKKCCLNSEGQSVTNGLYRDRGRGVRSGEASKEDYFLKVMHCDSFFAVSVVLFIA